MSTATTHRPGAPFYVHIVVAPTGTLVSMVSDNRADAAEMLRSILTCDLPYRGTLLVDPRHGAVWDDSLREAQH